MEKVAITDLKICDGPVVQLNDVVELFYRVSLPDGTEIESTFSPDIPINLRYSELAMLKGLYLGMAGMRTGGSLRKIQIPSGLAFGARSWQNIPANTDLIIEITLSRIIYNT